MTALRGAMMVGWTCSTDVGSDPRSDSSRWASLACWRRQEEPMLTVSAPAKELLRTIEIPDDRALRLDPVEGGQLRFFAGAPHPDDQVVRESGEEVLRVAGVISDQLDGHSLERVETPEVPGLPISRPEEAAPAG